MITLVQHITTNQALSPVTTTITASGSGNLLMVIFHSGAQTATVTDNAGAGNSYVIDINSESGRTGDRMSVYYAKNCLGGATSVTVTNPGNFFSVDVLEYSGVDQTTPIAFSAANDTAGPSAPVSPNLTVVDSNSELVTACMLLATITADSPWITLDQFSDAGGLDWATAHYAPGSSGTFNTVFSPHTSTIYGSLGLVLTAATAPIATDTSNMFLVF